ncbi:MAG: winged helix-turn-helix transcriptional regulator, partial [Cocleimonas sp.]|nr:winged helix-turn-helix transcriptional regulator [Cocleimonas sp.]
FSRDEIMNGLSGIDSELFSRSVDILVSRLRQKLKPLDCIQTVWGVGYRLLLD